MSPLPLSPPPLRTSLVLMTLRSEVVAEADGDDDGRARRALNGG